MASVSYQTIKLSRGKHSSAEAGVCVIELASMLAGEPFSDHPESVCPVIAALLRAYNDAIDDRRRQDLYVYAAKVVGSRGSSATERSRARQLTTWAAELKRRRPARRLRRLAPQPPMHVVAWRVVAAAFARGDRTGSDVLRMVDELLAIGAPAQDPRLKLLTPAGDDGTWRRVGTTTQGVPQSGDPGVRSLARD